MAVNLVFVFTAKSYPLTFFVFVFFFYFFISSLGLKFPLLSLLHTALFPLAPII